jgi:formylglycine-generating enzyme required for sulfatase activity
MKEKSMKDWYCQRSIWVAVAALVAAQTAPVASAQEGWAIINPRTLEIEEAVRKAPKRTQPPALTASLTSVSEGSLKQRIKALKKRVTSEVVFVEGGDFMMGDYGPIWPYTKRNLNAETDNKPLHKVRLTSYSLSRYRTTFAEYDVFTEATGRSRYTNSRRDVAYRHPTLPVGIAWQGAKDYCQWLGQITGLPFDLPTEAQWEYAARNRGGFVMFATDNGNIDPGRNVPTGKQSLEGFSESLLIDVGGMFPTFVYPIGLFPPSPLGLYDMTANGYDWTNDWYAADYYAHSPEQDPSGPSKGTEKVLRGFPNGAGYESGATVNRTKEVPNDAIAHQDGVRCAVNHASPVKAQL